MLSRSVAGGGYVAGRRVVHRGRRVHRGAGGTSRGGGGGAWCRRVTQRRGVRGSLGRRGRRRHRGPSLVRRRSAEVRFAAESWADGCDGSSVHAVRLVAAVRCHHGAEFRVDNAPGPARERRPRSRQARCQAQAARQVPNRRSVTPPLPAPTGQRLTCLLGRARDDSGIARWARSSPGRRSWIVIAGLSSCCDAAAAIARGPCGHGGGSSRGTSHHPVPERCPAARVAGVERSSLTRRLTARLPNAGVANARSERLDRRRRRLRSKPPSAINRARSPCTALRHREVDSVVIFVRRPSEWRTRVAQSMRNLFEIVANTIRGEE